MCNFQDLQSILTSHPLGKALVKSKVLDSQKRTVLVDVVAQDMVQNFGW
jgi:hypothetical protein